MTMTRDRLRRLMEDVTTFMLDGRKKIFCSPRQLGQLAYLCIQTDIEEDSLAVHLRQNELLADFFTFARDLIRDQRPGDLLVNMVTACRTWIEVLHPEKVPFEARRDRSIRWMQ